jgi:toxin ParE1/3/4
MRTRWTPKASKQLETIYNYIADDSLPAAETLVEQIYAAIKVLEVYPECGRSGRIQGTRELVVTNSPYIVFYRIRRDSVHILAIIHGARKLPKRF